MTTQTLPPFDAFAEEAIIAALLLDPEAIYSVRGRVRAADFFREANAFCFDAALAIHDRGEDITLTTLAHQLDRMGRLDHVGGEGALVEIGNKYLTAIGVEAHCAIVARDATYRRAIELAGRIAREAYIGGPEVDEAINRWREQLTALETGTGRMGALTSRDVVNDIIARGQLDDESGGRPITAGWYALDELIHGFAPGEVVTIGARTSIGKTAFSTGMARRMAEAGHTVGYVVVEGDKRTLTNRIAASYAGVSLFTVTHEGGWKAGEREAYDDALERTAALPLLWPEHYMADVQEICAWASVQAHSRGMGVLFIDHIDVARFGGRFNGRAAEISRMMQEIQNTARREGIVMVVLSQLSRRETRKERDRPPVKDDLRESGAKEELSQVVLLLHRPESSDEMDVYVAKNTEGPTGKVVRPDAPTLGGAAFILDKRSGAIVERTFGAEYRGAF